jgi:hypothetical protein
VFFFESDDSTTAARLFPFGGKAWATVILVWTVVGVFALALAATVTFALDLAGISIALTEVGFAAGCESTSSSSSIGSVTN